ncbi:hypothetical protein T09_10565 [Trichinella sp. T9]|nr:hypothetical protein T09_10565 [Trichinella sp. T9]
MRTREMQDQKYDSCLIKSGSTSSILLHHSPFLDICIHHQYNLEVFLTVCLGILRALVAMTRAKKQISFIIANDKNIADLVVYKFFLSLLINITVLNI